MSQLMMFCPLDPELDIYICLYLHSRSGVYIYKGYGLKEFWFIKEEVLSAVRRVYVCTYVCVYSFV